MICFLQRPRENQCLLQRGWNCWWLGKWALGLVTCHSSHSTARGACAGAAPSRGQAPGAPASVTVHPSPGSETRQRTKITLQPRGASPAAGLTVLLCAPLGLGMELAHELLQLRPTLLLLGERGRRSGSRQPPSRHRGADGLTSRKAFCTVSWLYTRAPSSPHTFRSSSLLREKSCGPVRTPRCSTTLRGERQRERGEGAVQ